MAKQAKKYICIFLLLELAVFIVPKEFIHSFYGHTDTVHEEDQHAHCMAGTQQLPQLDNPHQHCWILTFNAPVYLYKIKIFQFAVSFTQQVFAVTTFKNYCYRYKDLPSLRGPPFA